MPPRAEREQHDHHRFVIPNPVAVDETPIRTPAHRDRRAPALEPRPVGPLDDAGSEAADLGFVGVSAIEPAGGKQHAHEQQRGIDARQLGVTVAQTTVHIEEMVEEAAMPADARGCFTVRRTMEEAQRRKRPCPRRAPADPAALDPDRIGGQGEADSGDAAERRCRPAIGDEAIIRPTEIPEPVERPPFEIGEQRRQCALAPTMASGAR